jgi:hypothetical protein
MRSPKLFRAQYSRNRPAGPPSYQFGSLPTPATATNRSTSRVTSLSTNAGTRSNDTGVSSRAINS